MFPEKKLFLGIKLDILKNHINISKCYVWTEEKNKQTNKVISYFIHSLSKILGTGIS